MQTESPCTCAAVRRLSRRVTHLYDRHLAELGIRTTQYSLLSNVRARPGLPMGDLAQRMGMDRSTLTRNLRPLVAAGWVRVGRGDDARTVRAWLTDAGRALQSRARAHWRRAQDDFESRLGPESALALHRLAESVSGRLEHAGAPHAAA